MCTPQHTYIIKYNYIYIFGKGNGETLGTSTLTLLPNEETQGFVLNVSK